MVEASNHDGASEVLNSPDDAAKVPLTDKQVAIQVKDDSDDIEISHQSEGLTKEELMAYANDPYWVRLRIAFMAMFWLGWFAMLAIAVWIIMVTPACAPPPSSTWLQKNTILEVQADDPPQGSTPGELAQLVANASIESVYIANLVDEQDYKQISSRYDRELVLSFLMALSAEGLRIVTDFVPTSPSLLKPFIVEDVSEAAAYDAATLTTAHLKGLENTFEYWQTEYNVTGFLMAQTSPVNPSLANITRDLNSRLNPEGIAFGTGVLSVDQYFNDNDSGLEPFKKYLNDNYNNASDWYNYNWTYYQANVPRSPSVAKAELTALAGLPGTPLLRTTPGVSVVDFISNFDTHLGKLMEDVAKLRTKDAVLYGSTQYANNTSPYTLAFTRTLKGTPGYAVAINRHHNETEVVSFEGLQHSAKKGTVVFDTIEMTRKGSQVNMAKVAVSPQSGLLVQFVAEFEE